MCIVMNSTIMRLYCSLVPGLGCRIATGYAKHMAKYHADWKSLTCQNSSERSIMYIVYCSSVPGPGIENSHGVCKPRGNVPF